MVRCSDCGGTGKVVAPAEPRSVGAFLASAVLLLRRVKAEEDLPADMGREFELSEDIGAFLDEVSK